MNSAERKRFWNDKIRRHADIDCAGCNTGLCERWEGLMASFNHADELVIRDRGPVTMEYFSGAWVVDWTRDIMGTVFHFVLWYEPGPDDCETPISHAYVYNLDEAQVRHYSFN